MSWKTTDSARRSGISDYNRGSIKVTSEFLTADEGVISDLSLQTLFGYKEVAGANYSLDIIANSLAFNNVSGSDSALRIAIDNSGVALFGRNINGPAYGQPDPSFSFGIDKSGNMLVKTTEKYKPSTVLTAAGNPPTCFSINDNVGISKDIYGEGNLEIANLATFYRGETNRSSTILSAHFKNSTQTDKQASFGLTPGNITTINGGDLSCNVLSVDSSANIKGNLLVNGVILPNFSVLSHAPSVRVENDFEVSGNTIVEDLSCNKTLTTINLDVCNNAVFNNVRIFGDFITGGHTHATDSFVNDLNVSRNLTIGGNADISNVVFIGDNSGNGNKAKFGFNYVSDNSSNNYGYLGINGDNEKTIVFNSEGKVVIGNSDSYSWNNTNYLLDVSGMVNISAQSDYINGTPSLSINNISRNDSTGASIELTAKRAYHAEGKSGFTPQITGADIILRNYNDANSSGGASVPTTKVHGVIKTFQTDNSWNRGDFVFYGQDVSSIYAGTDSSGITEFMRFNSDRQAVRIPKKLGVGTIDVPLVSNHVLPNYPDPSAVIDARIYSYYGQSGRSEQPDWLPGNILIGPENYDPSGNMQNGLIWKPLAGHLNSSNNWTGNYTKESAAIKFTPEANYYRGGLAFYTNNDASLDVSLSSINPRMTIDMSGNISMNKKLTVLGDVSLNNKLTVEGDLIINGQPIFNSGHKVPHGASDGFILDRISPLKPASIDISNNSLLIQCPSGVIINNQIIDNLRLTTGYLSRDTPDSSGTDVPHGYLTGNYVPTSSSGKKSYPIFALSSGFAQKNHISSDSVPHYDSSGSLVNWGFYGIGYTQDSNNMLLGNSGSTDNWGMYLGAKGKIGCFLDGGEGASSFINAGDGGHVGIGTKNPTYTLDISGDVNISNKIFLDSGLSSIYDNSGIFLTTKASGSEKINMRLDKFGFVSVGSSEPSRGTNGDKNLNFGQGIYLQIEGAGQNSTSSGSQAGASHYGIGFGPVPTSDINSDGPAGAIAWLNDSGAPDGTGSGHFEIVMKRHDLDPGVLGEVVMAMSNHSTPTVKAATAQNGYVKTYGTQEATNFTATSDISHKTEIKTITDATDKLTSLRGVSYKLKQDNKKHYGVIAQELEKVFPEMVHGKDGEKSVAYMEIIGVLIETVKDLNKRIKKLEESSK